jgi:hypothetical protein
MRFDASSTPCRFGYVLSKSIQIQLSFAEASRIAKHTVVPQKRSGQTLHTRYHPLEFEVEFPPYPETEERLGTI